MLDDSISVYKTGATITTSAISANVATPTNLAGDLPNYVRVSVTAAAYVKLGPSGVAAVAGDTLVLPSDAVILKVGRNPFIAAIQQAAAGVVQISPLEDL